VSQYNDWDIERQKRRSNWPAVTKYFPFSKAPKLALFNRQSDSSSGGRGVKQPERKAEYQTGFSARIKNASSYISMSLAQSRCFSDV
jgi:hypothetical protein